MNHYIRLDGDKIIKGFSDAFEQPEVTDVLIAENAGRHFELFEEINPSFFEEGIAKYAYIEGEVVVRDITAEVAEAKAIQQGIVERQAKQKQAEQKATQMTVAKMLLANELTDDEILDMVYLYPAWNVGIEYKVGDMVEYLDRLYEVIQAHTSQDDWRPPDVPALFTLRSPAGVIPEWTQPTGAHDAYNIGDKVTFEGQVYESLIDGNTWSPTDYPQGWELIE